MAAPLILALQRDILNFHIAVISVSSETTETHSD